MAEGIYGRMKSAIRDNSVNATLGKFAKLRRIRVIRATIIPTRATQCKNLAF